MHDIQVSNRLDEIFGVLTSRRRRHLLYGLSRIPGGAVERAQLVEGLHAFECLTVGAGDAATARTLDIDLHHNHLPRLDEGGFVDYDRRQGTVRYEAVPSLTEWLDHARHKEIERRQ